MSHFTHCHLLGRKINCGEATDTELLDDVAEAVLHDTEVVHYPDYVENSETDSHYGSDIEVVPDSDDDMMDSYGRRQSGRRMSFIESLAADLCKVESHSHPLCKNIEQASMDIDTCADERHTSCNGVSPIIVHSDKRATVLCLRDGKMTPVKDPCIPDSVPSDVNITEDVKPTSESKVEKNGKLSLPKKREVSLVYTRRKNKLCKAKDNVVEDVIRLTDDDCNNYTRLNYIESQEPEDLSTVLLFVDQYISSNPVPVSSSPVSTVKTKQKSPLSSSAKGAQSLVRWSGVRNSKINSGIFDWNDSVDGDEECVPSVNKGQPHLASGNMKYNNTYVRMSPSLKSPAFTEQDQRVREEANRELGQQAADESTLTKPEDTVNQDSEHFFDVGIGTQIAVEAMQALSSSLPAIRNEMDADNCPQKMHEKSKEDTQKRIHPGVWSFPKKTRSAYRNTLGRKNSRRVYCSDSLADIIQASKQAVRRIGGKLAAAKCVFENTSLDSGMVKTINKPKPMAYRAKEVYIGKENMNKSLSGYKVPCKLNTRKKIASTHPSSTDLKSSSLFNMHVGLVSKPIIKRVCGVNSASYIKGKDRHTVGNILDVSAENADISEDFNNASFNTRGMKLNGEDRKCLVVEDYAVDRFVEKKSEQMENCLSNIGKEGSKCTNILSDGRNRIVGSVCNNVWSTNWCLGDYPRGKRACRSIQDHSEGYCHLDDSSIKASHEKHNHYSLKGQMNEECRSGSSTSLSGLKRKRRSTVYISPCLLSSKKYGMNLLMHPVSELKNNVSVYEKDYAKKKNTPSEQLTDRTITVKASAVGVKSYKASENPNTLDAAFPSYQASTNEKKSPNLVDSYCQQHDKKKPSTPSLTRELHRLGFRDSMPDFTSKTSRRRKTMANIRVMLSQNLDESTRKDQMKILTRLGVPIASGPSDATHFITNRFARTQNMLEFIAQGKPVVTHQWLESCDQTGFYIDDRDYIVRDVKKERELGFKLPISLNRARHNPLLKDYRIFITPNVKPGKEILAGLVKAVHGEVVNVVVYSELDNLLVLSCEEDQSYCIPFLQKGISAYSTELLLNGIIIQKLEFARHRLFTAQ